jgi:hypothetical protein
VRRASTRGTRTLEAVPSPLRPAFVSASRRASASVSARASTRRHGGGRNVAGGADGAGRTIDFKTAQGYIDLAGETFRAEEELLAATLFGQKSGQKQ